ncbi:MAG TPA: iron-containing alcohol dehydrogenase [Gaiellaceae bacterium]
MIVRWGLDELPAVLREVGVERPLLVASERWTNLDVPRVAHWSEVPSHRIEVPPEADSLLAVGGGSAIDTAKFASSQTELPVVSVPTTYSGAEWAHTFGIRSPDRRMQGGGGGAQLAAIVYDVDLTLELPLAETVGTALNALAHCAEALYVQGRNEEADRAALEGARLIARALPRVVEQPDDRDAREELLRGACHAGEALGLAGLGLAHAIAQALGGRYGLPHGAMNALALPPALRFNALAVPQEVVRFGQAIGAGDPAAGVEQLAALGRFGRLRDFGVPREELADVAEAAAQRGGNQMNPRQATPSQIEELLAYIW